MLGDLMTMIDNLDVFAVDPADIDAAKGYVRENVDYDGISMEIRAMHEDYDFFNDGDHINSFEADYMMSII